MEYRVTPNNLNASRYLEYIENIVKKTSLKSNNFPNYPCYVIPNLLEVFVLGELRKNFAT